MIVNRANVLEVKVGLLKFFMTPPQQTNMISFNFVAPLKMQSAKNIDFELSFYMAQNGLQRFNSVFGRILGVCLLLLPFCFLLWHANSMNARGNPPL